MHGDNYYGDLFLVHQMTKDPAKAKLAALSKSLTRSLCERERLAARFSKPGRSGTPREPTWRGISSDLYPLALASSTRCRVVQNMQQCLPLVTELAQTREACFSPPQGQVGIMGESLSLSLSLSAFMWNNYQERIKSAKQSREHVIAEQQNSMMWKTISRLTLGIRQQHYVDSQAVVAGVCSVEHNLQKQ